MGRPQSWQSWTAEQNEVLRREWGVWCERTFCDRLKRRWNAIRWHASRVLGLPLGVPQGCGKLLTVARMMGYSADGLRKLCQRHEIHLRRTYGNGAGPVRFHHWYVDVEDVRAAVDQETREETLDMARKRVQMAHCTLRAALLAIGVEPPKTRCKWRIDPKVVDRAVAAWRNRAA